ncbi:rhodanese-like domain-containing protein [Arthrobacter mangrovi]|uniref:Sulfurtransferase n=1 Tax=Arthrobacter mangrovi TaxID=2966350 RepID=A0ABQ5MRY4_9MICC|nr:rhodanese-like domain-containing protein [Arthrobacter mangrovi]GLB66735.1 sulfurtransferase [Arthrobacter mangrovi]
MTEIENVDVESIGAGAKVLDVREDYEWEAGHIEGALHIPMNDLPERVEELDPDEDVYVICRSGGRSFRVVQWLVGNGYTAMNVSGGMGAWLEAGKPMVADNGQEPTVK